MSLRSVIDADLTDVIYNTDDFAVAAVHNGTTTVNGLFDKEQVPTDAGGAVQVISAVPIFRFKTGDITPAEGDTLLIDGITYTIKPISTDGMGETTVQLQAPA